MSYYTVKVVFKTEDGKKITKTYLTQDESCMSAEVRTIQHLSEVGESNYEVKSVSESSIVEVIELTKE